MTYQVVIGLEVHTQLLTKSKIFSGAATNFGADANTQACLIDAGLPGVLPVLNEQVVDMAIKFGLSVQANIAPMNVFARKNYAYPDLPKGYQISQFEDPIVGPGFLDIDLNNGQTKRINITRAHLEEDAGKSLHHYAPGVSAIDLNRAGTPLLEIVSEPEMHSAEEAIAYLKTLHQLVRYLGISDGNMQEGSFRCDINISLRPPEQETLGTRAEIKNVNSFRFIEKAIEYEIDRQTDLLDSGQRVVQETRQYDPQKDITRSLRSKEQAHDYRYFPDPDLLPVKIDTQRLERIAKQLPELPWQKKQRYIEQLQLPQDDAKQICQDINLAMFFEQVIEHAPEAPCKTIAHWITGSVNAYLNKHHLSINDMPVSAKQLAQLIQRIMDQTVSNSIAKTVFERMCQGEGDADAIIEQQGLKQITDTSAIENLIDQVIEQHPNQVNQYRAGKDKLFSFFVGKVMQATKGKANPKQVNDMLRKKLGPPTDSL